MFYKHDIIQYLFDKLYFKMELKKEYVHHEIFVVVIASIDVGFM